MVSAIIFDFDDTLVQTKKNKRQAFIATADRFYNFELTHEEMSRYWGVPFHIVMQRVFGDRGFDVAEATRNYISLEDEFPVVLFPETIPVLEKLSSKFSLGILTATTRNVVSMQMERLKLTPFFKTVQTADDTDVHKPDPKVFVPVQKKYGDENLLYVGDSHNDQVAALGAQMNFIGIHRGSEQAPFDQGVTIIQNLEELFEHID